MPFTPAHRRRKDPFAKAIRAPLIRAKIPRCPRCGKNTYDNEASAKLAVKRHSAKDYPMLPRPYFDEECQAWHLTSAPQREAS